MTRETAIKIINKLDDFKRDYSPEYNLPYLEHKAELINLNRMVNIVLDASKSDENIEQLKQEIEALKAENKKLKDPFYRAPNEITCISVDRDGAMYWNERKPIKHTKYGCWEQRSPFYFVGYDLELAKNWETLIIRKEEGEKP